MKKSLLAVAAMGAFASAAQAQSSVTVYGVMDVGYISQSVKQAGAAGQQAPAAGTYGVNASTTSGFASSAETTSRLGLKGTEDLGGGSSALFTVETTLNPNSSTVSAWNTRQAFLGLKKNGIGMGSIGTQYTPIHEAVAATDAGQQNNMPGDLIYPGDTTANAQNSGTNGQYPATPTLNGANPGSGSVAYTVRVQNSLRFATDTFYGLTGKLMYVQASNTTNPTSVNNGTTTIQGAGQTSSSGWAAGVDYTWQKLLVTGNYQNFKQTTYAQTITNATGASSLAQTLAGTTWGTGVNTSDAQTYIGGTYDFGILKAYAQWITRKASAVNDSGQYAKRSAQQIGVRSFITPTIEAWGSVGTGKITNAYYIAGAGKNTQTVSANLNGWQLGSNYYLSKRTNLYAIVGSQTTSNAVYPTTQAGGTAAINANSNGINAYALGVRHTF